MEIIKDTQLLIDRIQVYKSEGRSIGFTPTMGALHSGHISLVEPSLAENDISIVSIFVNPTQFNEKSDLAKYPRDLETDAKLLEKAGVDILYAPTIDGIYPDGSDYKVQLDLGEMVRVLEGEHRPGHFEGVLQVVKRLLDIVEPNHLYMGQKDFQQFSLIQAMISKLNLEVKLRVCPIKRAANGLALSSRNRRLSKEGTLLASIIHMTLTHIKNHFQEKSVEEWKAWAMENLSNEWSDPEYFEFSDGFTLANVIDKENHNYIVASTAVWIEKVRLIDNMIIKKVD